MHPPVRSDTDARSESSSDVLTALRRFARTRSPAERCELCSAELAPEHPHLLNRHSRQIACSCDGCAILFCGQQGAKFLRVPRRVSYLDGLAFTDLEWEAMTLPINLAFFLRQPDGATKVMYPSPAGAMESLLEMPQWSELFAEQETLGRVEPEVEALLVNRIGKESACFIVPIDACYRLVGLIRTRWHGLSGGVEVWQSVAEFFAALERQATHPSGVHHA
jgi:hypothetical protein